MRPVSVVVPIYNESPRRILMTVESAITAGAMEVVVIDDGSAEVPFIRPSPFVRFFRKPHEGISAALNYGVRKSVGEFICWLSAGDLFYPNKVEVQCRSMIEFKAPASFHDYDSASGPVLFSGKDLHRLRYDNLFCGSTTMVHRSVFDVHGAWWDESLQYCVDWDWHARIQFEGPGWYHVNAVLGAAYEYPGGHSDRAKHHPGLKERRGRDRAIVADRWRIKSW